VEPVHADRLPPRRRSGQPLLESGGHCAGAAVGRRQRHEGVALPVAAGGWLWPVVSGPRLRCARRFPAVGRAALRPVGRAGAVAVAGLVRVAGRRGLVSVVLRPALGGAAPARPAVAGADGAGGGDGGHRRRRLLPALSGRLPDCADRGGAVAEQAWTAPDDARSRRSGGCAGSGVVGGHPRASGRRPALHRPRRATRPPTRRPRSRCPTPCSTTSWPTAPGSGPTC
jgi:hypothetical protein